jgi:hypothetical protein
MNWESPDVHRLIRIRDRHETALVWTIARLVVLNVKSALATETNSRSGVLQTPDSALFLAATGRASRSKAAEGEVERREESSYNAADQEHDVDSHCGNTAALGRTQLRDALANARLTAMPLNCAAKAHAATAERRAVCHVRAAISGARGCGRRDAVHINICRRRLGRRTEAGPRQLQRLVRRRI